MRGEVVEWAPLGACMTDVLVREDDGRMCWYASTSLTPDDGQGPLPSRAAAQKAACAETERSLLAIRDGLVSEWHRPWPGAEFGKAIVGQSIDGALADVRRKK
jgi:hypothetical protein